MSRSITANIYLATSSHIACETPRGSWPTPGHYNGHGQSILSPDSIHSNILTSQRTLNPESDSPHGLVTMSSLAWTYRSQGRYGESEQLYLQVLEGRKKALGVGHVDTLSAMSSLASTYRSQGRYGESEQLCLPVLEGRKKALGVGHVDTLSAMSSLASTYRS